ncbi:MAG: T9SS type A sorting domain-containing protein [Bacteroidota bacterium]|nr:T9SS type A sorting domain-containing protein [Bacteroidota bacterium]
MKKTIFFAAFFLILSAIQVRGQISYWHQTSGPEAGTLRDITIDSSGRVIVWTSGSGVYRSLDNGTTWELLNKGLPRLNMARGAALPSGYLFAYNLGIHNQLFRLNQNVAGAQWEDITPADTFKVTINDILADPNGTIYLATSERGVLRSDDNGNTWLQKNAGLIDTKPIDKEADLLAIDRNSNLFVALAYGTIWRSADHGDTWTQLPKRDPVKGNVLYALAIAANGNVIIGNHAINYVQGGQIFVSRDTGNSWDSVYRRPATTQEQKNQIDKIILLPGTDILYANVHGPTLRSLDNGITWVPMDTDKRGDEVFSMAGKGNRLFQICEPDGIFLSEDNGLNWDSKNKGLIAQFMWGVALNSRGDIFGITEFGLHRSTDNGDSWELEPEYGETYVPSLYINSKDFLYIGTDRGLFRSKDNGQTLNQLIFNRDTSLKNNTINQVGENGQGKLFCASNRDTIGFSYSTDDGDHWIRIRNLPDTAAIIKTFAFASRDTILLAGTSIGFTNFYRSVDQGAFWEALPSSIQAVSQVLIHGDGSYLALIGDANGGVYRSNDGAKNWVQIFPPSDFQQIFNQYFSMTVDDAGSIVVCTDSGIYRSATGDTHFSQWFNVSGGLTAQDFPNHYISASQVAQNHKTHVFFAASRGLGVYRSIPGLGVSADGRTVLSPVQVAVYPNPSTAQVNISFQLKEREDVRLNIYDVMGKRVQSILNATLNEGKYSEVFDGSALPSGSYMIVLQEGGRDHTNWVTITR